MATQICFHEDAQCSETDLCVLWTIVGFLVFDIVDIVLELRSELGK